MERPGHLSDLTISDLTNAGVKKLHARRLKSEPAVYHDAIAIEDAAARGGDSAMMNAGTGWFGGVAEGDDEDDDDGDEASYASRGNRASHNSVELDAKVSKRRLHTLDALCHFRHANECLSFTPVVFLLSFDSMS